MLRVWRGQTTIFAECTECGSYGTANHLQPKLKLDPDIEAALDGHKAHMLALRSHYTKAVNSIATQIRDGSLKRIDGAAKVRELWHNHVAQVRLGEASLPNPEGKVKEVVADCPWCGAQGEEIEIEKLPDGLTEPEFSLAQKVVPEAIPEAAPSAKRK
jgi:hypothetical protein